MPWRHKGSRSTAPLILNPSAKWGEWSVSWHDRFSPGCTARRQLWIGGWADPRVNLDIFGEQKICSCLEQKKSPDRPAHSVVTVLTGSLESPCTINFFTQTKLQGFLLKLCSKVQCWDSAVLPTATTTGRTSEHSLNFIGTGSSYTSVDVAGNNWILIKAFYN